MRTAAATVPVARFARRSPVPRRSPYLFLAPYLLVTAAFFLYPLLRAVELSFYQTAGPHARLWNGLENFTFIFGDPDFRHALLNTTVFAIISTALMLPTSLGLALLLNTGNARVKGFFRLVFFLPNVVAQTFVGIIFFVMFTPRYGLVNKLLQDLFEWGLATRWLENPSLVMPAIVLANAWLYTGLNMVYFLAALQNVDVTLVDAARIDGAGRWNVFRHVTLPAIKPVAVFVLVMCTIGSYQLFELPYALMRGTASPHGPANSGLFIVSYLYDAAYNVGDLGLAAAVGWVLALVILVISLVQLRLTGAAED
jgi:ABC-type sugar transport system permease subunit